MRRCEWCEGEVRGRRDARFCSRRCRQSAWRFRREIGRAEAAEEPRRLAVADPPYPGLAGYYRGHPDYAGEVDHVELLSRLQGFDGWVLFTSSAAAPGLMALCSEREWPAQLAVWLRGDRPGKSRAPRDAWEGVLYRPAREVVRRTWPANALSFTSRPRPSDPRRVIGAKPSAVCSWVFELMGARRGDELADLFPGSGGVSRAWSVFTEG